MYDDKETSFERQVLDRLIKIETKLDGIDRVKQMVYENQRNIISLSKDVEECKVEINETKDKYKWLWRAIGTALVVSAIEILFMLLKAGAGIL